MYDLMAGPSTLLELPAEVLSQILLHLSPDAFVQLTQTCKQLYKIGSQNRDALLRHLDNVPGIKLGLDDRKVSTLDLFRMLHRRASLNLLGAGHHADCHFSKFENGSLDARASCISNTNQYFNISLASKGSATVRHYGSRCADIGTATPSPDADGSGEVLQVIHNECIISILYAWEIDDGAPQLPSPAPKPPDLNSLARDFLRRSQQSSAPKPEFQHKIVPRSSVSYRLIHYNPHSPVVNAVVFAVMAPPTSQDCELVPLHIAIHSRLKCAIIWDCLSSIDRTGGSTRVIVYVADNTPPPDEVGVYKAIQVWPWIPQDNAKVPSFEEFRNDPSQKKAKQYMRRFVPRATAFIRNGNRLKLYAHGMLNPYGALSTRTHLMQRDQTRRIASAYSFNHFVVNGVELRTEKPFFGVHSQGPTHDAGTPHCVHSYLQLAVESGESFFGDNVSFGRPAEDGIFIVQSHDDYPEDGCGPDHLVRTEQYSLNCDDFNVRVVAQLRGWSKHWRPTNLTALDIIAVSKRGTRIAIAMWDRILVYTLDTAILVEDWTHPDDDESDAASQAGSDHSSSTGSSHSVSNNDAAGIVPALNNDDNSSAGEIIIEPWIDRKIDKRTMVKASRYYDLAEHPQFGEIVELWPIELKLPHGAIARKVVWPAKQEDLSASRDWTPSPRSIPSHDPDMKEHDWSGLPDEIRRLDEAMTDKIPTLDDILSEGDLESIPDVDERDSPHETGIGDAMSDTEDAMDVDATDGQLQDIIDIDDIELIYKPDGTPYTMADYDLDMERKLVGPRVRREITPPMSQSEVIAAARLRAQQSIDQQIAREAEAAAAAAAREAGRQDDVMNDEAQFPKTHGAAHIPSYATMAKILADPTSKSAAALRAIPKVTLKTTAADVTFPSTASTSPSATAPPAATSPSASHGTEEEISEEPETPDADEEEQPTLKGPKGKQPIRPDPLPSSRSRSRSTSPHLWGRSRRGSRSRGTRWRRPRRKRNTEDELVVLTDRGVMVWDLGPMSRGRRTTKVLDEEE
ncbi:uncharacterized protein AB675_9570 [Cyphellophora attinorum]|uniref:F-box domain-containing protein n=1 Tax=Cyphellophora attinorum TaxID=1664694 RepID=A0A0N1P1P8_9EURO|nr:uncharacterized protein AB675_9570 [Phialophora attinorum]KPI42554.1 hypothetical protein AB675_9570 [Phialophora attinorum]